MQTSLERIMVANYASLRMNGSEFILVPKDEFRRMTQEDRRDAQRVARAVARLKAGRSKAVPLAQVKRKLRIP